MPLTFTVEDMKTPEKLERLFQRVRDELNKSQPSSPSGSVAAAVQSTPIDLSKLAAQIAPMLRSQLQATGPNPLNTGILLPSTVTSITGTTNQVIVNSSTGDIVLSLPQSIAVSSTPQFARLGLGAAADATAPLLISSGGTTNALLGASSDLTTYNIVTLNAVRSSTGMLGILGGGGTDKTLYVATPTGGGFQVLINGTSALTIDPAGAIKISAYGAGPVLSDSSGNLTSGVTVAAPSTSVGVAIVDFYGTSATNFLGTPNAWLGMTIGGTAYKLALYT